MKCMYTFFKYLIHLLFFNRLIENCLIARMVHKNIFVAHSDRIKVLLNTQKACFNKFMKIVS